MHIYRLTTSIYNDHTSNNNVLMQVLVLYLDDDTLDLTEALIGSLWGPLSRGPLVVSLYILIRLLLL